MDIRNLISDDNESSDYYTMAARPAEPKKRKLEDLDGGAPQKKRSRSPTPTSPTASKPRWAETYTPNTRLQRPGFVVRKKAPAMDGRPASSQHPLITAGTPIPRTEPRRPPSEPSAAAGAAAAVLAAPPPPSRTAKLLGAWEASITGSRPTEELTQHVLDFLWLSVMYNPSAAEIASRGIQFELEAKLGMLVDRDTDDRVSRGILTPSVLQESHRMAFRSSMTEAQHKGLNMFLNETVVQTAPQNPKNAGRVPIQYLRRREADCFVELPRHMLGRIPGCMHELVRGKAVKLRVTYDQKTRKMLGKIVKVRVKDLSLHMPSCPLDCRFSVNLEMDFPGSPDEVEALVAQQQQQQRGGGMQAAGSPDRSKDRLSYTHGPYQIDLTQVTQVGQRGQERIHELEIELASNAVVTQATRVGAGEENAYAELIEGWIDNVIILARKARDFGVGQ